MRKAAILLAGVALLWLLPSVVLKAIYGPSYTFPPTEDCWMQDGDAGWMPHGKPSGPPPSSPSVNVPVPLRYLPIFLPTILLLLFMFGPLSKKMQDPLPPDEDSEADEAESEIETDKDNT